MSYLERMSEEELASHREGQKIMTNMLRAFDAACRKKGVSYWCTGGTMIGTLRHQGWIPHDADMDVAILASDYAILKEGLQDELPAGMFFQNADTDHHVRRLFSNNSNTNLIERVAKIKYLHAYYKDDTWRGSHNGLQLDIFIFDEKDGKLIPRTRIGDLATFDYDYIFPLQEMPFEDMTVYIAHKYEEYSKRAWGAYPPPVLPANQQYPHEGRIGLSAPQWCKDMYPHLYANTEETDLDKND
jgi:phosphorylcholine metabolism protein LicD